MKQKVFFCIYFIIGFLSSCFMESSNIIPYMEGDKYGFVDQDLRIIIHPTYDRIFEFNGENLYAVRLRNNQSKIIDLKGDIVFSCSSPVVGFIKKNIIWYYSDDGIILYNLIEKIEIADGIQRVFKANDEYIPVSFVEQNFNTYIDVNGSILFPNMKFKRTFPFYEGIAIVIDNDWNYCLINDSGELIKIGFTCLADNQYNEGLVYAEGCNGEYGFMDTKGEYKFQLADIYPIDGTSINHTIFSEGYAFVQVKRNGKISWLMVDENGVEVITDLNFYSVEEFKSGFSRVSIMKNNKKSWNFIDLSGELLSNLYFDEVSDFYCDYSMIKLNGEDFLMDRQGELHQVN